jgi:hypothetical protein
MLTAQQALDSCVDRGQNPKKIVFGSRELFEKLKKRHLTGKRRDELRQKWKGRRYGFLYSREKNQKKAISTSPASRVSETSLL